MLGQSLIIKEQEMLEKYRDKLEESELEERHYEKKGLLDSSSSDEDDEEM